jgi:ADP-heptose:LPS heptosyltransferase
MSITLAESRLPQRVLLCRTDRLGDLVLALPCANLVKTIFPHCQVDLLVSAYTAPVARLFTGADHVLEVEDIGLSRRLRAGNYNTAIALFPSFSIARALVAARIPNRAGIAYRWFSPLFTYRHPEHRKQNLKHEAEYNLSLTYAALAQEGRWEEVLSPDRLFPLNLKAPEEAIQRAAGWINATAGEKVVALHPGGSGSARRWGSQSYAELAGRLGQRPDLRLVVTGGVGEKELCHIITHSAGARAVNLCGRLNLPELAALFRRCDLLITNSTGPLHLARALGCKVLGLFPNDSSMTPKRWGPYGLPESVLTAPAGQRMEYLEPLSVMMHALDQLELLK